MKTSLKMILTVMAVACLAAGCSKSANVNAISGKYIESDFFTLFVADNYSVVSIDGGVQAIQGKQFLEVYVRKLNQSTDDIHASINILSKTFGGSIPDRINLTGSEFFHTSIEAQGVPQDIYLAVKDGYKIGITLSGKDHTLNQEMKAMFSSIKLKL
ncbi:MAG TPA: hypothetical protein PK796_10070 [Bacteroidales bacterium]|nr:hypothetical protein [Bacteroidales bacterium]